MLVKNNREEHPEWWQQAGFKREAREWEADRLLSMREEAEQGGEGQMWRALKDAWAWSQETASLACSPTGWFPPPAMCFFNHSLLSGLSVMLESSCGQRETAFMCYLSQAAWCFLTYSPPHLSHLVSRSCPFSLPNLPEASYTFKTWKNKPQLPALSSHHPLPLHFTNKHLEWVMDTTLSFPTHCNWLLHLAPNSLLHLATLTNEGGTKPVNGQLTTIF